MLGLKVGRQSPVFKLKGAVGGEIKEWDLSQMRGKWVVFFFYPADFTFVCPTEVVGFNDKLEEFKNLNAEVLGCSVDSPHVHIAWAESLGGINYPLLSDVHHSTSIDYNVFVDEDAQALRGTFIIDPEGLLRWYEISDNSVGRNVEEIMRVLEALQTGKLCPVGWKKGQKTLN